MFTIILYLSAFILLGISYKNSRLKTFSALKKAWKSFENILPQLLEILIIIGILLSILKPETISGIIGAESGWLGMAVASLIGSITLLPGFVAFPLASALLGSGAGFMQIAVFVSTLMMVGIATIPIEVKYFGNKATIIRNLSAFLFSYIVAIIIGAVVK